MLSHNQLTDLPPSLAERDEIGRIVLDGNHFHSIPRSVTALTHKNLSELSLDSNRLSSLPGDLGSGVSCLSVSHNAFAEVPAVLRSLTKLTELDLSNNHLHRIPAWLSELSALERLDFSNNIISAVSARIGAIPRLSAIRLAGNKLSYLPDDLFEAHRHTDHLRRIDLSGNQLAVFPPAIGALAGLDSLNLRGNPIQALPASIARMADLEYFDIRNTLVDTVPPEMARMSNLTAFLYDTSRVASVLVGFERREGRSLAGRPGGAIGESAARPMSEWFRACIEGICPAFILGSSLPTSVGFVLGAFFVLLLGVFLPRIAFFRLHSPLWREGVALAP
jgi:Leucine-rich repeat (LRR) protein